MDERARMRVSLAGLQELHAALRQEGAETVVVLPAVAGMRAPRAVGVGVTFADATPALWFTGTVRACATAPGDEERPFRVEVVVDAECAGVLHTVTVRPRLAAQAQRRHPRRKSELLVSVTSGNLSAPGCIEDLSLGGARIVADLGRPIAAGETLSVEFLDRPLRQRARPFFAEVRWTAGGARAFGVRFGAMDAATLRLIEEQVGAGAATGMSDRAVRMPSKQA